MNAWFLPLHHRVTRLVLAAAISVPVMGTAHVLPVGAVGCNPPVPCVDNSVTFQGNEDEFAIFTGAVQTIATAVEGDSSPVGQVVGTVAGDSPLAAGDGCVIYKCSSDNNGYELNNVWFYNHGWQHQQGNGSYNGAWFWPRSQPNTGSVWGFSGGFNNVYRNTSDICSAGLSVQVKADQGSVQSVGGPNGYQPNNTTRAPTGQSTQFGLGLSYAWNALTFNLSATESVDQAWVTQGSWDSNRDAAWVVTYTNDNSCHPESQSVYDLAPWQFSGLGNSYAHWNFIWSYSYHD